MKIHVLHELKGRIRFSTDLGKLTAEQADQLQYYLLSLPGVVQAKVYDRSGDAVVQYQAERRVLVERITQFSLDAPTVQALVPEPYQPSAQPVLPGENSEPCAAACSGPAVFTTTASGNQSGLAVWPLSHDGAALPAPPQAGGTGARCNSHCGLTDTPGL